MAPKSPQPTTSRRRFLGRLGLATGMIAVPSLLAACQAPAPVAPNTAPNTAPAQGGAAPLKVGLLLPGSKSDQGWMESGYDGLVRAQEKHGDKIKTTFVENVPAADMEQGYVSLAQKSDLVIGGAGQAFEAGLKVAPKFPNVKFSLIGGTPDAAPPNVARYDVGQAQIAFVAGAAAGLLSKTGMVGFVGGIEIPPIVNAGKEYVKGAQYARSEIKSYTHLTGDFEDIAKAKEAALAGISQGVDVMYHILNLGLKGLEEAARETRTRLIGSYTSRCGTDPLYIAYSVTGVGYEVEYAIDQVLAGTWKSEFKAFGLKDGPAASDLVICDQVAPEIPAKISQLKADIIAGKIQTLGG
jgi:basic membrane protein A and related proteins